MPYVRVRGVRTHFREHSGSLSPLLLVHGAGGACMQWPGELRRLPGHHVCALDLPGHGNSAGAGTGSVGAYAEFVRDFADVLGWERFSLAGHSMGGAIGIEFALRFGARLQGLVLVATGARLRVSSQLLSGLKTDFAGTTALLTRWAWNQEADTNLTRLYLRRLREASPQVLLDDFTACDSFDRSEELSRIVTPTLVICGIADRLTPVALSQQAAQDIPGARLVVLAEAGHMVALEQPDAVGREVASFLLRLPAVSTGAETRPPSNQLREPKATARTGSSPGGPVMR